MINVDKNVFRRRKGNFLKRITKFAVLTLLLLLVGLTAGCKEDKEAETEGTGPQINALDYIELGQYKGLSVKRMATDVTDEEVEQALQADLLPAAEYEEITDHDDVRKGDIANIDFVGKKDGVAFDGGTGSDYDLEIGSGTFIPGFEDQMIGMKVGETKDLNLTFPENYGAEELAGEDVVFEVTVNGLKKEAEAAITDETVKNYTNGEYTTVDAYKQKLKEDIITGNEQYADSAVYTELWEMAVDNAKVKGELPKELVEDKKERMKRNALSYAESYHLTMEEFLNQSMGVTEEEFEQETADYALKAAKETLVLNAIAETEGLTVTDEDLETGIDTYVELYQYPSREDFLNTTDMDEFREYILESKVQKFLADNAVIEQQ
ncbi:MAG: trigger factor [Lachnospiraceae bacterium]|nr:trigger factor [Lachnospiraceae bacterium]